MPNKVISIFAKIGSGLAALEKNTEQVTARPAKAAWNAVSDSSPNLAQDALKILKDIIVSVADTEGAVASDGLNFQLDIKVGTDICKLVIDAINGEQDAMAILRQLGILNRIQQPAAKAHLESQGLIIRARIEQA